MTSRHPFTPAQWQELEHQALFFKFMVSGLPIPPDLIFSLKVGWTCFQLGLTQSSCIATTIDSEQSRCRRTDGKKWRCSRHTYSESKYCERHMHRGKSRTSRKHLDDLNQLQNIPSNLSEHESASAGSGTQSNSNLSSVTTHSSKDSTLLTIEELSTAGAEKRERIMQYHQFIEESPETSRDSWLKLVI